MKIELNIRNKAWKKAIVAVALILAFMVAMLVAGINQGYRPLIVVALLSIPVFAFLLCAFLQPSKWNCMRMVKGEMTYRELEDAIAREDFDEPICFLERDWLKSCVFRVSENWALFGERFIYDDPFCIPKSKVRSIEIGAVDLGQLPQLHDQEDDPLLELDDKTFYAFELVCDDDNSFISGFIAPNDMEYAFAVLRQHFPQAEISGYPEENHEKFEGNEDLFIEEANEPREWR